MVSPSLPSDCNWAWILTLYLFRRLSYFPVIFANILVDEIAAILVIVVEVTEVFVGVICVGVICVGAQLKADLLCAQGQHVSVGNPKFGLQLKINLVLKFKRKWV